MSGHVRFDSDVDVQSLIDFADAYAKLGGAVQDQFVRIMDSDYDGINANAVEVMKRELVGFHEDIDLAIKEYYRDLNGEEECDKKNEDDVIDHEDDYSDADFGSS